MMIQWFTKIVLFLFVLMVSQCSIPLELESYEYSSSIVVDGLITDRLQNHTVSLMYAAPVGSSNQNPLKNADVLVVDSDGNEYPFKEEVPGNYTSEIFSGIVGTFYKLQFSTSSGRKYESDWVELLESPPIDSIYDRYAELPLEGEAQNVGGIQFFLDTHVDLGKSRYFRYEWEEDFKIITPLIATYIWDNNVLARNEDTLHICYGHNESKSMIIGNSLGNSDNRLVEFPIRFVPSTKDFLRNRYRIMVRQYAVSQKAYTFYQKFKELNESGGSLFDKQQGTVYGNVISLSNPEEVVLGNFEVAGVSQAEAFFNFEDLDPQFSMPDYRASCEQKDIAPLDEGGFSSFEDQRILIYLINRNTGETLLAPIPCMDCTGYGPTVPPSFWRD